jgi:predicted transcriptional regulator
MTTSTSFKLDELDKNRLKALAMVRGQSMTSVVRQLLRSDYRMLFGLTEPAEAVRQARRGVL